MDPAGLPLAPPGALFGTAFHDASVVSQFILRYEFRPGSTLYVVYIHRGSDGAVEHSANPWSTVGALASPRASEDRLEAKLSLRMGL